MKQLLILSGKGGTGKTTLASAFAKLADAKMVADCDVDAPNLHLITQWEGHPDKADYYGLPKAHIDPEKCIECGACQDHCRFGAISSDEGYRVNLYACEGCAVCAYVCPSQAISMKPSVDGETMLYATEDRVFSTAQLKMGSGTSGKLVTEVKKRLFSQGIKGDLAIIDGSPGIGCPVIASLSGVHMVLIVAEPSLSGISDMERIIKTGKQFGVKMAVCVNKYDTHPENTEKIKTFCLDRDLTFVGTIPYDPEAVKAVNRGQTIVDVDCPSGKAVEDIFEKTIDYLFEKGEKENV